MGFESLSSRPAQEIVAEKSEVVESLKNKALPIGGQFFKGLGGSMQEAGIVYEPNTWNENAGTIIFADERGEMFAIPSTDERGLALMNDPHMIRAEGMGVPHLNDADFWQTEENRGMSSAFATWQQMQYDAMPVQREEVSAQNKEWEAEMGKLEEKFQNHQ